MALRNGLLNGNSHTFPHDPSASNARFSDIPPAIDIQVAGADTDEAVELSLEELPDDSTELCTLLESERAPKNTWMVIALAYAKQDRIDHAVEILNRALQSGPLSKGNPKEKLGLLSCVCWLHLLKSREAPRVVPEGQLVSEAKTKDAFLQLSTGVLNEATRIHPSFSPLFLTRGVLYLLRASLFPPSKAVGPGNVENSERIETLRNALKSFDDASRASNGRNIMAVFGRARTQYCLGQHDQALKAYQEVLVKMPGLTDPDPRIGIGCCLWQLNFKEEAKAAWERALELSPKSKVANLLLGIYYLWDSAQFTTNDATFTAVYKKAMTMYTQEAFKLDKEYPLTCSTFASFFLFRRLFTTVETLARKAIEMTDVNAIASDGWYLLARKEHYAGDETRANDYYNRSDQARGGADRGYLPAKFGAVQMQISLQDFDGAKFRLEKIIQQTKNPEAMMLLGALYAEDIVKSRSGGLKEDKSAEIKKALSLFEVVRMLWKDEKKNLSPDESILIYLSQLYESTNPEKSMQCLRQVERMQLEAIPDKDRPEGLEEEEAIPLLREHLTPQLLNNMGCFLYQAEKTIEARELFQTALNACVKLGEREEGTDTDALVTTISYNLARTYEAAGLLDEAKGVYEGLLARHSDYTDASARLTYIALLQSPHLEGPKAMAELYRTDWENLEVRALFGWYLSRSKKRVANIAEDAEQRHYKHTLQNHDKHDRYSLTGMGNLYSMTAREMKRETDQEKEKRRKMYERAVEFFDKAIQLDPQNAYAAQGIAIALAEDKREFGPALQIFTKVRDTMKEANVHVNLGHIYAELKNWTRSIENYEIAISKAKSKDPQILACLGRVWLMKGKAEKNIHAMQSSLDCAERAFELDRSQLHLEFNVAFVQMQIAQLIYGLPESRRHLDEVEKAAEGLETAIETLTRISKDKNSPYNRGSLEQRAAMGKNTMRRQLERSVQAQKEYEEKNAEKLRQARATREVELAQREEIRRQKEEAEREEKRKIAEERHIMLEEAQKMANKRAEEERAREEAEFTTDSETGNKVKRRRKAAERKRKKKGGDDDMSANPSRNVSRSGTVSGATGDEEEKPAPRKKRKLERKTSKAQAKYKSSEIVVESDSDDGGAGPMHTNGDTGHTMDEDQDMPSAAADEEDEDDMVQQPSARKKKVHRIIADDDDEDEEDEIAANTAGDLFNEVDASEGGAVNGKGAAGVDNDGDSPMRDDDDLAADVEDD